MKKILENSLKETIKRYEKTTWKKFDFPYDDINILKNY